MSAPRGVTPGLCPSVLVTASGAEYRCRHYAAHLGLHRCDLPTPGGRGRVELAWDDEAAGMTGDPNVRLVPVVRLPMREDDRR